jgi:hypothetical protein
VKYSGSLIVTVRNCELSWSTTRLNPETDQRKPPLNGHLLTKSYPSTLIFLKENNKETNKSWDAINLFRSLAVTWRETPPRKTKLLVELTTSIMQSRIQLSSTLLIVEGMAVDVEAVHATVSVAVGETWTGTDVATVWAGWEILISRGSKNDLLASKLKRKRDVAPGMTFPFHSLLLGPHVHYFAEVTLRNY